MIFYVVVITEFVYVKLILECIIFVLYVDVKLEYVIFMVCNEKLEYIICLFICRCEIRTHNVYDFICSCDVKT